jgi:hypothetical protein
MAVQWCNLDLMDESELQRWVEIAHRSLVEINYATRL